MEFAFLGGLQLEQSSMDGLKLSPSMNACAVMSHVGEIGDFWIPTHPKEETLLSPSGKHQGKQATSGPLELALDWNHFKNRALNVF